MDDDQYLAPYINPGDHYTAEENAAMRELAFEMESYGSLALFANGRDH